MYAYGYHVWLNNLLCELNISKIMKMMEMNELFKRLFLFLVLISLYFFVFNLTSWLLNINRQLPWSLQQYQQVRHPHDQAQPNQTAQNLQLHHQTKETVNTSLTLMGAVKVLYFSSLVEMLTLLFTLTNVNKHSPKWKRQVVDIYQAMKPQGKYPQQATDTEVNSCLVYTEKVRL